MLRRLFIGIGSRNLCTSAPPLSTIVPRDFDFIADEYPDEYTPCVQIHHLEDMVIREMKYKNTELKSNQDQ